MKLLIFKKIKLSFPVHPILFAVFPILSFSSHNKAQLSLYNVDSVNFIIISIFLSLLLWALLTFIIKNKEKSALFTSLFLILFFSYGHVHNILGELHYQTGKFAIGTDKILFSTWIILLLLGFYFLIRTRRKLNKFSSFLTITAALLVISPLFSILSFELGTRKTINSKVTKSIGDGQNSLQKPDQPPDIYYIIFDGFPRSDTLKEVYNYNNDELINHLTNKGFYVVNKSNSNYAWTHLSLPASLNMHYMNYLTDKLGIHERDTSVPKAMIEDNKVAHILKSLGYKFIFIGSEYGPTLYNKYADVNVVVNESSIKIAGLSYRLNEYTTMLLRTTLLSPFMKNFINNDIRAQRLNAVLKVSDVVYMRGPKYVFAHLVISHPPPLFDREGNPVSLKGGFYTDQKNNLNQIIFAGKMMKLMVDDILSKSEVDPIIILQADHGPTTLLGHPFTWKRPFDKNIEGVKERMRILNAFYLPDGGDKLLYDSISPVNTFRLIFNYYFGADYELLPDKAYYSDDINRYEFFDVTEMIK